MTSIIKFTFINLCCFIIYKKALDIKPNKLHIFITYIFSLLFSIIYAISNTIFDGIDIYVMIISLATFHLIMYKKTLTTTLSLTILSIAISFLINYIEILFNIPIALTLGKTMNYNKLFYYVSYILGGIISLIMAQLLFMHKRIKKIFTFMHTKEYTNVSLLLSTGIVFIYSFFRFSKIYSIALLVVVVTFIFIIGITLFITNEREYTARYNEHIKDLKIDALKNELEIQYDKASYLENINSGLDQIIHRDNKLIPAMEAALREVLITYTPQKAESLLKQLNSITEDRKGILNNYEYSTLSIAYSDNTMVNSIINYLYKRALELDISFQFTHFGDISKMINNKISEDDLCTLIADMLENAIIATQNQSIKHVFVSIEAFPDKYTFSVYDSGEYFSKEVIKRLGKKRYTTHKDTGGTGIGLMTTFELMNKYKASFSIDEELDNPLYTKCVSITFDNRCCHTYNKNII